MRVCDTYELTAQEGTYGLELELETLNGEWPSVTGWRREHDGSLRRNGIEYVMSAPKTKERTLAAIRKLYTSLAVEGTAITCTGNAGTHLHMNVQPWEWSKVYAFIYTFLLVEELLIQWCGPDRVGNHFCVSGKESIHFINTVKQYAEGLHPPRIGGDYRYSALNLASLQRYGSLEIRCMSATSSPEKVIQWVEIIDALRSFVNAHPTINDVSYTYKDLGWAGLLEEMGILPHLVTFIPTEEMKASMVEAYARTYPIKMVGGYVEP